MNAEVLMRVGLRPDGGPGLGLPRGIANGCPHSVAALQQLDDAPAADVPRAAGDQDRLAVAWGHRSYPITRVALARAVASSERPGLMNRICTSRSRRSRSSRVRARGKRRPRRGLP